MAATKGPFQKGFDKAKSIFQKVKKSGKRHQLGFGGKVGASIAVGAPIVISGGDVLNDASIWHRRGITMGSLINKSILRYINNLGQGFIGWVPFDEKITMVDENNRITDIKPGAGVPKWSFLGTALTGMAMVVVDRVICALNHGKGVKFPFTNVMAVGN